MIIFCALLTKSFDKKQFLVRVDLKFTDTIFKIFASRCRI